MNYATKKYDLKKGLDFIGITCVFYCHDGKGNLLMSKRSQNCRDERGVWDCGSGSMEFGEESLESACKREILEEYCVKATKVKLQGTVNVIRKQGKRKSHWIGFIFTAQVDPKKVRIGEPKDIDEIGWFPLNKLPKPQHSMLLKHLKIARANGDL
jgi:ADP-ribose pyrophosphatase YjhB (NUDIX family)